jgi:hypothetical protein
MPPRSKSPSASRKSLPRARAARAATPPPAARAPTQPPAARAPTPPPARAATPPRAKKAAAAAPSMWSTSSAGLSHGLFPSWMRSTLGPLLLIAVTLPFPALIAHACADARLAGSGAALVRALARDAVGTLRAAYVPLTARAATVLAAHSAWQLALMRLVPGRAYSGPLTPSAHVPRYVDNGVASFLLTIAAFFGLSTWGAGAALLPAAAQFSPAVLYDVYLPLVSFLPIGAAVLCAALLVKGLTCPSTREAGSSGNIVVDFFWGTEVRAAARRRKRTRRGRRARARPAS